MAKRLTSAARREKEKQATREKIVAAATRVLLREGVDGFSMRKLAAQIGYTPTAIYFHFPDRQALLGEVVDRQFMVFRQAFEKIAETADPLERLASMGEAFVEFAQAHPDHYRFMFLCQLDQIPRGKLIEKGNPSQDCYALLVATVSEAMQAGRFRPELQDPQMVAQVFFAGVHGLMALHLIKGQDDWVQWAPLQAKTRLMIEALIAGLSRESPGGGVAVRGSIGKQTRAGAVSATSSRRKAEDKKSGNAPGGSRPRRPAPSTEAAR